MRKLAKVSALLVAGFMLFAFTNMGGGNNFEGVITYTFTPGSDAPPQLAQFIQGSTIKIYIKGNKIRTETNFGMSKTIDISDKSTPGQYLMLKEYSGNKYEVKMDDSQKKTSDAPAPEIKYLSGTKTVAGYACKEAQVTVVDKSTGNPNTVDIYYTDQLPFDKDDKRAKFKGLAGFPLSYTTKMRDISMTITAQSINKQSVPDSLFAPTGYTVVTQEQLSQQMSNMGGGMGGH